MLHSVPTMFFDLHPWANVFYIEWAVMSMKVQWSPGYYSRWQAYTCRGLFFVPDVGSPPDIPLASFPEDMASPGGVSARNAKNRIVSVAPPVTSLPCDDRRKPFEALAIPVLGTSDSDP